MIHPSDVGFFVLLAVLFPLWAALFGLRRLRRAPLAELPRARLWLYRRAMLIQWTLTIALAVWWIRSGRDWSALGLSTAITPGTIGVIVGLVIVAALVVKQRNEALRSDAALAGVRQQLANLERMLPRSRRELSWFYGLAVTAGLCEEFLYRGFVIWFLAHWMGLIPAAIAGGVLFGLAHAYQGPRGMALTAAVGLFLGGVYLVSGSIWLGIAVHALMDVHSGHLGYVALTRAPSAPEPAYPPWAPRGAADGGAEAGPERTAEEHVDVAMEPPPNSMTEPRGN